MKQETQAKLSREPEGPGPLTASSGGTPARGAPGRALSSRELPHLATALLTPAQKHLPHDQPLK